MQVNVCLLSIQSLLTNNFAFANELSVEGTVMPSWLAEKKLFVAAQSHMHSFSKWVLSSKSFINPTDC